MSNTCKVHSPELPEGLHLIELPQPMDGFRRFISSWFFVDSQGRRILVDPGPANSMPMLLDKLSSLTDKLDLVLLTHIHLDHSGGIAQLCEAYDDAMVLTHRRAGRHLSSPEQLWNASFATLGDVAKMYGKQKPISHDKLLDYDSEILSGIKIMETPGHATHHLCFMVPFNDEKLFFIGEAAGIRIMTESGTAYHRPASPGKFDVTGALRSLDEIDAFIQGDELLCYGHFGTARDGKANIRIAKNQIHYWLEVISGMEGQPPGQIMEYLIANDKNMAAHASIPEDMRKREQIFLSNNIRGFFEYLKDGG